MSQKIIKIHLLLILDSFMAMYYVLWHTNRKGLPVVSFYAFTGIFKIIFEPTAEATAAILVNILLKWRVAVILVNILLKWRVAAILNFENLNFSLKNIKTRALCCFLLKIGHFGWKMLKAVGNHLGPRICHKFASVCYASRINLHAHKYLPHPMYML